MTVAHSFNMVTGSGLIMQLLMLLPFYPKRPTSSPKINKSYFFLKKIILNYRSSSTADNMDRSRHNFDINISMRWQSME